MEILYMCYLKHEKEHLIIVLRTLGIAKRLRYDKMQVGDVSNTTTIDADSGIRFFT